MRHISFKRSPFALCFCGVLLLGTLSLQAQFGNLFSSPSSGKKSADSDAPTVINSDAMDMDMANDRITLLRNVDVQDKDMNIKCRKMIIFLGKDSKQASNRKKNSTAANTADNGKSVQKIECTGDVVITQKQDSGEISQQAFAGKAIYFSKDEKIILTEKPVVVKGTSRLEGETITLYTRTDRVLVVKPVSTFRGQVLPGKSDK